MRLRTAIACAVVLLGCVASAAAQTVTLQFNNGRVTLNAQNAAIRTILTEWARLGGTKMVNHERLGGAPVTLELTDMPEQQVLDVLLRTAAGYVVTAREGTGGGASMLGGVVILATSSAPRTPPPVTFGAATAVPLPANDSRDDQQQLPASAPRPTASPFTLIPGTTNAGPNVVRVGPGATAPFVGAAETVPPVTQPPAQRPSSSTPQVLPGTSRPGEITPQPQPQPQPQPNQR